MSRGRGGKGGNPGQGVWVPYLRSFGRERSSSCQATHTTPQTTNCQSPPRPIKLPFSTTLGAKMCYLFVRIDHEQASNVFMQCCNIDEILQEVAFDAWNLQHVDVQYGSMQRVNSVSLDVILTLGA